MSETNDNKEVNEQAEADAQEAEASLSSEQEAEDQGASEQEAPEATEASAEESEASDEAADDAGSESSGGESAADTSEVASSDEDDGAENDEGNEEGSDDSGDEEAQERSEPVEIPELPQIIEGAVLAADKPLSIDHIIQLFPGNEPSRKQVREAIQQIQENCEGRGFEFKEVASGYRFQVRAEYGEHIGRLWEEKPPRYTRALLETLALIAYKQPITRGDIEEIRGVSVSTNIIRTLLEREWIRVVGHRDVPGRPSIYATTKTFLDYFDLSSLDELPTLSEIKDLDKVNEELQLEGELIEPRTLNLEEQDQQVVDTAADDESLDEVTDKVNQISENIKNLFKEPEEDDIDLDDDELDEAESGSSEENESEAPEGTEAGTTEAETSEAGDAATETDVDDGAAEVGEETAEVDESEVALQAENAEAEFAQSEGVQEEVTQESIEETDATPEEASDAQSEDDSTSDDSPFKPQQS